MQKKLFGEAEIHPIHLNLILGRVGVVGLPLVVDLGLLGLEDGLLDLFVNLLLLLVGDGVVVAHLDDLPVLGAVNVGADEGLDVDGVAEAVLVGQHGAVDPHPRPVLQHLLLVGGVVEVVLVVPDGLGAVAVHALVDVVEGALYALHQPEQGAQRPAVIIIIIIIIILVLTICFVVGRGTEKVLEPEPRQQVIFHIVIKAAKGFFKDGRQLGQAGQIVVE